MRGCKSGNALTPEKPASKIFSLSVQPAIVGRIAAFLHPWLLFIFTPAIFLYKSAGSVVYLVKLL